jgi:hypothetical protein
MALKRSAFYCPRIPIAEGRKPKVARTRWSLTVAEVVNIEQTADRRTTIVGHRAMRRPSKIPAGLAISIVLSWPSPVLALNPLTLISQIRGRPLAHG